MAQYILGNAIKLRSGTLQPGKLIDDRYYNVPELQRAGAVLALLPDEEVDARSGALSKIRREGGVPVETALRASQIDTVNAPAPGLIVGWNAILNRMEWQVPGAAVLVGVPKVIRIPFDFSSGNVDSATSIPVGARILRSIVNMVGGAPFDTPGTVDVIFDPTGTPVTLQAGGESDLQTGDTYQTQPFHTTPLAAIVRVAVTPAGASVGSGEVLVEYLDSFLN